MDKKAMKAYQKAVYGNPNWVDGRINRKEYFIRLLLLGLGYGFFMTFSVTAFILATGRGTALGYVPFGLLALLTLFIFWRLVMTYVKRLHDLEWSGWLAVFIVFYPIFDFWNNEILSLIVSLGVFVLSLILLFKRGTRGVNKYGKDPLVKGEE